MTKLATPHAPAYDLRQGLEHPRSSCSPHRKRFFCAPLIHLNGESGLSARLAARLDSGVQTLPTRCLNTAHRSLESGSNSA